MIDALNANFSYHRGSSRGNSKNNISFQRLDTSISTVRPDGYSVEAKDNLKSLVFVGGCAAAVSFAADALINLKDFMKFDSSLLKLMVKNAAIWAGIGGLCFGFFKFVEKIAFMGEEN